jgi:hypothetical protein
MFAFLCYLIHCFTFSSTEPKVVAVMLRLPLSFNFSISVSLWLYSPCGPRLLFPFFNLYTVGSANWTGDQPVARPLSTHRTTQTQNKRTQTSMPRVGFESTTIVFERAKTVQALDRAATVISFSFYLLAHTAIF